MKSNIISKILVVFWYTFPSFSDVFPDLGMTFTLNDEGKLAIPVAYCLQVLKKSSVAFACLVD